MRRWSLSRSFAVSLGILFAAPALTLAQPAGSSPEAAFEAFESSQAPRTRFVEVEEAKAQMVGPACSHAVSRDEDGSQHLESCIQTMQESLGWDEANAFQSCSEEGIARLRLDSCAAAISTFLVHHTGDEEAEAESAFSLAVMKDRCAPSCLCTTSPDA